MCQFVLKVFLEKEECNYEGISMIKLYLCESFIHYIAKWTNVIFIINLSKRSLNKWFKFDIHVSNISCGWFGRSHVFYYPVVCTVLLKRNSSCFFIWSSKMFRPLHHLASEISIMIMDPCIDIYIHSHLCHNILV